MKNVLLNFPMFGLAVATRAALGAGLALVFGDRISPHRRRTIGIALVAIGAATTVPVVRAVLRGAGEADRLRPIDSPPRLH